LLINGKIKRIETIIFYYKDKEYVPVVKKRKSKDYLSFISISAFLEKTYRGCKVDLDNDGKKEIILSYIFDPDCKGALRGPYGRQRIVLVKELKKGEYQKLSELELGCPWGAGFRGQSVPSISVVERTNINEIENFNEEEIEIIDNDKPKKLIDINRDGKVDIFVRTVDGGAASVDSTHILTFDPHRQSLNYIFLKNKWRKPAIFHSRASAGHWRGYYLKDLNKDGIEEIIIYYGKAYGEAEEEKPKTKKTIYKWDGRAYKKIREKEVIGYGNE